MRVAIVNDLSIATEALRRLLVSQPDCTVAWTAPDGAVAVERSTALRFSGRSMITVVTGPFFSMRTVMSLSPCAAVQRPRIFPDCRCAGNAPRRPRARR